MNLALYHPWVYLHSGIERMLVEIVARSRHDWTIYTHHHSPDTTYPELRDADVVELSPRVSVRRELRPLAHAARTMASCRLPAHHDALLVSPSAAPPTCCCICRRWRTASRPSRSCTTTSRASDWMTSAG